MSSNKAKLSQTFHSLNIAGKHLGSNYKVCLGSVFHEEHVFEVCLCLQRFESLQKVECLADDKISRDILSHDSVVRISPAHDQKSFVFLTQKKTLPNTKHCEHRRNGQKHNTGYSSWVWLLSKRTVPVDSSETPHKLATISNSLCFKRRESLSLGLYLSAASASSSVTKTVSERFAWQKKLQTECRNVTEPLRECSLTDGRTVGARFSDSALIVFSCRWCEAEG